MVCRWGSDCCDCIIDYNNKIIWVNTVRKCRLHKLLIGQNLLNTVIAQSQRFNLSHGRNPTELERDEIVISREVNKRRIRAENLDNYHEHLPQHHDPTFFENLKKILRNTVRR